MPIPLHSIADVAAAIRDRRRALDLSQAALAERVGVSRQWIVAVERGKARAEVGLILRALDVLGVSLAIDDGNVAVAAGPQTVTVADIDAIVDRARGRVP